MWEHYRFTGDKLFLRKRAYPVLKDAAEFFCAYMVEDPQHGWLVTGPSDSPENSFRTPTGGYANESMGPTCDRVLVHALFNMCLEAEAILSIDSGISSKLKQAQAKLAPLQIGRYGQLQEWLEDFEQAEPNHRHTSHLITLYPEHQISPDATPTLAKAARITLERRIHNPKWEDTEWSRANLVNYYAKLWDGEEAHQHLVGLIAKATDDNLLSCSRGGVAGADQNIFAIDDNTAGAAAVAGRFDSPVACTASGMARRICHWPLRTRRFPCRNALAILPARLRRDLQQGGWKLLCAPRRSTRPCSRGTGPSGTAHGEVVCRQAGISESC
jgi:alpha-L-fucosidase 2